MDLPAAFWIVWGIFGPGAAVVLTTLVLWVLHWSPAGRRMENWSGE